MNPTQKRFLTWLGCSGAVALGLVLPKPLLAQTVPIRELIFSSTQTGEMVPPDDLDCGCTGLGDGLAVLTGSDAEGDMAIALRGCDCAGCRFIARQEMQRQLQASISIPVQRVE
ncbi:hypothetical protein HPC62_16220 [Thermoleptolyngbya sichuanensis A183]|uniref:Uncharacterized protein n=1 Tax=Thermoleptolyngbya sichuanensis A183 TaxID=2737172 RepID=A0A6M8B829_9CYAN|nr:MULTISPECIES: hypothetical protein [Thermoleptolyngbya]MDG2617480.1 hypothetical protein [Thermoleptolyngbya sichuanensis XZ-Cy5]QKD83539.1 hypothetical protein HPC62_16220 [Thermoleptolyngbya sichuanensis A183]